METELPTTAIQDYAKAIYSLESKGEAAVSTTDLADRLSLTAGSVSAMLRKLNERGIVEHERYRGVRLTREGRRIALQVIRRHRLLEQFLVEVLEMPWDRVHDEAEILEHVLSDEVERLIAAKLGDPEVDPHGDPIPTEDFEVPAQETVPLNDLGVGDRGRFVRVSDADPAMLRYLSERGISPGEALEVIDRQPFGGPLSVRVAGTVHPLGGQLAEAMRVEVGG
jgi:DtxR family transcriptional regulator, Mn-dependent transcriptional regulator